MCPEPPLPLLLLLLLAALSSETAAVFPEDNTGTSFVVAFPENIAYYYPSSPQNKIQITALYNSTNVSITQYTYNSTKVLMKAGDSMVFDLVAELELVKGNFTNKTLQITSNNNITVHAISLRKSSMQTALVVPTDKLGTRYFIPPVPQIPGTTDSGVTTSVTERAPFRLIIINTNQMNTVTINGTNPRHIVLEPFKVGQIWLQQEDALQTVTATQPVAVLFGHTCAIRKNCTCGLLYTTLPPATAKNRTFYIPPVLANGSATFLLQSDGVSNQTQAFSLSSPLMTAAGTVVLYRPGLLLSLIPKEDFASCFVLSPIPNANNTAVIMVDKNFTNGVRFGKLPLENPEWYSLTGTQYVYTQVNLVQNTTIIWHTSTTMAVYVGGTMEDSVFGNPAHIISKTPDFRGCVLTPEVIQIGTNANGWRESLQYCLNISMKLISMSTSQFQSQIYSKILQANSNQTSEMWIGMRRSSLTGQWYWLNNDSVTDTNWGPGEPGTIDDGQCAIMSLQSGQKFGWRDEDCCKAALPVCYTEPVLFNI